MDELISRQAAIDAVGYYSCYSGDKLLFADKPLKALPSAEQKGKTMDDFGKWLEKEVAKEKAKECKQRNGDCYGCSFDEDCEYEELLNGLDEW